MTRTLTGQFWGIIIPQHPWANYGWEKQRKKPCNKEIINLERIAKFPFENFWVKTSHSVVISIC